MSTQPLHAISRRTFLKATGSAALILSLKHLGLRLAAAQAAADGADYRGWEDLYRQRWEWDRVVKGTHYVNCAYQRGCAWNVFVKDDMVWREEQVASYPRTNASVPDFNPRGCQKGACYSSRMYDVTRLRYPLKRTGARGECKWERIGWDQALREVADKTIDVLAQSGPGAVVWDVGTVVTNGCHGLGITRTVNVLDTPMLEINTEIGDHYPGATATTGKICFTGSFDDLFYSELILIWGGNPVYTHIPNAHFITEARYKGARVVAIAPDLNASTIHCDEWVPVNVGTDAALGLSLAQVMVEEGLFDTRFVREQTDLPFLVRKDTSRFLRQRDLKAGGKEDVFYVFDQATQNVVEAPRSGLDLGAIDPALEGEFRVKTVNGEVTVTPVFTRLREHLRDYTPDKAGKITGTHPNQIRGLARALAKAKAAAAITQTNFSKFYHGMEMERGQILAFALAGQIGKKGAGIAAFPYLSIDGQEQLAVASGGMAPRLSVMALVASVAPKALSLKLDGYSTEMILGALARDEYTHGRYLAAPLWFYRNGELEDLYGGAQHWDPQLKRPFKAYFEEALKKGWQHMPTTPPRIVFETGGNLLRRVRGYNRLAERLVPKLDLLVTVDWRMSNTARYSDYIFPAAAWYEKDDITWGSPIAPFCHVTTQAVKPLAEARTDWEFHCLFLKTVQQRAIERGITEYTDRAGQQRRLDRVYDEFTFGGRLHEGNTPDVLDEILTLTTNLGGIGWAAIKEHGYRRYTGVGTNPSQIGHATDIEPDQTITANTWQVQKKQPWPTLTRRIQFYIDQPLFLELDEALPVHKDNPKIGGDYALEMTGGHTRWSIHASWRDDRRMLRLQRGEPLIVIGTKDAQARGIQDGDRVRVYNDIGSFGCQAMVSPNLRPQQVIVYHAWEPYQFANNESHQSLIPSPMNPIHLAGGYYQLQPSLLVGTPSSPDRGTRVEIERAARG